MLRLPACVAFWTISLFVSGCAGLANPRDDLPETTGYARVNAALLDHHVLPRFERLAAAATRLDQAADLFCSGADRSGLTGPRERYHDVMDAWMGAQHLRFGPSELSMRASRLYFWPQARGRVGDALREAMEGAGGLDGESLARKVARASVAAQGLPALEYLLYHDSGLAGEAEEASASCPALTAVTANMQSIAVGMVRDWRGGDVAFKRVFLEPGPGNPYYLDDRAAALDLFKSFHGGLRFIADVKLKPVVGDGIAAAQPQLAESSLSGRSLRNIVVNLEALQALYLGDGGAGLSDLVVARGDDPTLDPLMRKAFGITIQTARGIGRPLGPAVGDETLRPETEKLLTQVIALKQIVKTRVADALDLTVGFNALDGD